MPGGDSKGGGGGSTEIVNTTPKWLNDLGEWSSDNFKTAMGKESAANPYGSTTNPYGKYKGLFGNGTGQGYLDSYSTAPKAAYNQAISDTKDMFGANGTYGSVGNGLMSGAMANAGSQYATAMSKAQQDAQKAMLKDYTAQSTTQSLAQDWTNNNAVNSANYTNNQNQQDIRNLLSSMGVSIPSIMAGQTIMQDSGDSGKSSGLGSILGGGATMAGMMYASAREFKEDKRPAETVLEKVKSLSVERWKYKAGRGDGKEHIGPYAEDWAERFGGSGKEISVVDSIGVLLKAVQELAAKVDELESERRAA